MDDISIEETEPADQAQGGSANTPNIPLIVTTTVAITTIVVGSFVFNWQQSRLTMERNNLQQEITVLEEQVKEQSNRTSQQGSANEAAGDRILITPENRSQHWSAQTEEMKCSPGFNFDPPTTVVNYTDQNRGIQFSVPYNPVWGNSDYQINPYDEVTQELGTDRIEYGPIGPFEGCGWVRNDFVTFLEPKPSSDYIADLRNTRSDLEPTVTKINGIEVVKYEDSGLCSYPTLVVIGKKHNYEFQPLCGSQADFAPLEDVVKSVRLLD